MKQHPNPNLLDLVDANRANLELAVLVTWTCPECALTMDAIHMDSDGSGWTCPMCLCNDPLDR